MGENNTTASSNFHTKVYVLSLIDVSAPLPFEIIPDHFFEKAKPDEVEFFKSLINKTRIFPTNFFLYERTEVRHVSGEREGNIKYESDELPPDQWRYWVVSHQGNNRHISQLQHASLLLKNEIEYGFNVISQDGKTFGIGGFGPALTSFLSRVEFEFGHLRSVQISLDDLNNIKNYYALITQLKPEFTHIHSALKLLDDLRWLHRNSDFIIVGLFSIIESLISHSPKLEFYHDSIKHQIRTKVPLLRKKFDRNLDYVEYFGTGNSEDKILSKLYDYRSKLVHNGQSQLSDEFSKILIGNNEIKSFLYELAKQLIVISLREPEFMVDLKAC